MKPTKSQNPPEAADKFLEWFCKNEWIEPIKGDLHEQYQEDRKLKSKLATDLEYWIHIFNLIRPFAIKRDLSFIKPTDMLKINIKTSLRILKRQKMYSSINVIGLLLGIVVCLNIGLFILDELDYDKFHPDYSNTYRVCAAIKSGDIVYNEAATQFPLARAFKEEYSGVEHSVRIYKPRHDPLIVFEEQKYSEDKFYFADASFFQTFGYELVQGQPSRVLAHPNSIVMTENAAIKYFGSENALGKIITYNDNQLLKVTGIVKGGVQNSHFKFDFIAPLELQMGLWQERHGLDGRENKWYWTGVWTYVKFRDDQSKNHAVSDLNNFVQKYFPDKWKEESKLSLQRIDAIHLNSDLLAEIEPNGSLANLKVFSIVAIILLSIAVINFVNLMTAQGLDRTKQIGISKTLGATKSNIASQILTETVLVSFFAGTLALLLMYFTLPYLNAITNKSILLSSYLTIPNATIYVLFLLTLGVVSGLYPATYLTRFNLLDVTKDISNTKWTDSFLKESMVGLQFVSCVVLIISMITINSQRKYLSSKNLGFEKENILVIKARADFNKNFETFKTELLKNPEILSISGVWDIPGEGMNSSRFVPEGISRSQPVLLTFSATGYDFTQTAKVDLFAGRYFDKSFPSDNENAWVLNEEAIKQLGWEENPIGRTLEKFGAGTEKISKKGKVIGVLRNYNFESMHHAIKPAVYDLTNGFEHYLLKFKTSDYERLISNIETTWVGFSDKWPMEYNLLDQKLETLYNREQKLAQLIDVAVGIALIIACIGIFGLSSFMISKRTKEVGIRRILGSKVKPLIWLLSRKFIAIVIVSNFLAWPVAYLLMNKWLENFQYAVPITWFVFLLSATVTIGTAFCITSYHAIKIASINPVKSLRYE